MVTSRLFTPWRLLHVPISLACELVRRQRQPRQQERAVGGPSTFTVGGFHKRLWGGPFLGGHCFTVISRNLASSVNCPVVAGNAQRAG